MSDCAGQYERVCKGEFSAIHGKLDRLDEAIRGNGRPGLQTRLDRLETAVAAWSRLAWLITAAVVSLLVAAVWRLVIGG